MKIEFNKVSFAYNRNKDVLKNINFVLHEPEIIFILGHTGSGKSTLVQHLNGLLYPRDGEVKIAIDDKEYNVNSKEKKIKELRKNVGLVFQFPENQLFETSVLEDVMFGPKNFGYSKEEASKLAKESLMLVGIDESYYERSPFELSGGEKRKVAIAGVIASRPKILVLDEPTSSLDSKSAREFFSLLKHLKEKGITIIVVSHDVNLCYEYADKVMLLSDGEIKYFGSYKNAFNDETVLQESKIEVPFVLKAITKLHLDSNARNMKELVNDIKRGSYHE